MRLDRYVQAVDFTPDPPPRAQWMGVFLPSVTLPTLGTSAPQDGRLWTATRAPKGPEQANPLPTLIGVVVQSIVEVAILCAVGWYLAKRGIVDAKAKKVSRRVVLTRDHNLG